MFKKIKQTVKNICAKVNDAINYVCTKVYVKAAAFAANTSGSDTTEKIGMVVVAVVIVGLLAVAVKEFMPDLFESIGNTAQEKLNGIFN